MKYTVHSYRYAQEILQHPNNVEAWCEIVEVIETCPLFVCAGKSSKNASLDVVQQCLNTYFDRALAVEKGWIYHPLATRIPNSGLAADFRKEFDKITVQAEVQFGNMSRWYSDVFKFQTAYSQSLTHLGLCIVPMSTLARRIDSNVVNYERVLRELPSAELSVTLPILVIGVEPDESTLEIDLRRTGIPVERLTKSDRSGQTEKNRYRLVHALRSGVSPYDVTEDSDTGPMAGGVPSLDEDA